MEGEDKSVNDVDEDDGNDVDDVDVDDEAVWQCVKWVKGGRGWVGGGTWGMSQSGQTFIFAAEHITHPPLLSLSETICYKLFKNRASRDPHFSIPLN